LVEFCYGPSLLNIKIEVTISYLESSVNLTYLIFAVSTAEKRTCPPDCFISIKILYFLE
jgi:hypothetical protein